MDLVRFKGGLGNQMFQYAFLKALKSKGRSVKASLGFYDRHPALMPFVLEDVFDNVSFDTIDEEEFASIDEKWKLIKRDEKKLQKFLSNIEERLFWAEEAYGQYDERVFQTRNCAFVGYWQTEKYFRHIRDALINDFEFKKGDEYLERLKKQLSEEGNYVSVHVRRGDYLNAHQLYGDICTDGYYQSAMKFMSDKTDNTVFIFFSDDTDWVKKHYGTDGICIEPSMFEKYEDWYDMCLMSCCAHNIIANSTFSWWGAWLNRNPDKIVIAPKKWVNGFDMPDICPDNWIRLNGDGREMIVN